MKKVWSKSSDLGSKMAKALRAVREGVERYRLRRWIKQRGSSVNVFIMDPKLHVVLESRGMDLVCQRCGEPLLVGDEVVSKPRKRERGRKTKYYHFECYRKLFV